MVENEIENIITTHFCRERNPAPLFKSLIFGVGEVTFSKKISILEKILEVAYPDLWKECKWVISRLNAIRRLRNKFAHNLSTIRIEDVEKATLDQAVESLTIERLSNDGRVIYEQIPVKKAIEYMEKARAMSIFLSYIGHEIRRRVDGEKPKEFKSEDHIENLHIVFPLARLNEA